MTDEAMRTGEIDAALQARLDRLVTRRSPATPSASSPTRPPSARRRHPAARARAAALGLSLATTGGLGLLFGSMNVASASGTIKEPAQIVSLAGSTVTLPTTTPSTTGATAATAPTSTVDGAVFSNKWGDVQVEAQFGPDGSLTDVSVLQSPYRDGKSVRINDRAVPTLNAEALSSQSAKVDTVSGATYTSTDYERSLQSAIDAARTSGLTRLA